MCEYHMSARQPDLLDLLQGNLDVMARVLNHAGEEGK